MCHSSALLLTLFCSLLTAAAGHADSPLVPTTVAFTVPAIAQNTGNPRAAHDSLTTREPVAETSPESPPDIPAASEEPAAAAGVDRHEHADLISIGHDTTLAAGDSASTVAAIFGSATSEGEVDDSVISVFGDSRVTGHVRESVVAVFGNINLNAKVDGNVVAVLGNVGLGPEAQIDGNLTVLGGVLHRDPKAIIHGNVLRGLAANFGWVKTWVRECLLYLRPLAFSPELGWAWGLALGFLALYLVIGMLCRGAVERCVETLETQPGPTFLTALVTTLLAPLAFVLLCVTVIGLLAVPFLAIGLFAASNFGRIVILAWLGRRCTPFLAGNPVAHMAAGIAVGGAIVLVLYTIPVVGFIVYKLLGFLGIGVVMYTLLTAIRVTRASRAPSSVTQTTAAATGAGTAGAGASSASSQHPSSPDESGEHHAAGMDAASAAGKSTSPYSVSSASGVEQLAFPRAGFWIRMGALLLDVVLVGILVGWMHEAVRIQLLALAAYGAVMWKLKATTVGGIVCGLRIVRLNGQPIDWPTAIVRALGCFLSLAVAGLGFIWIAVDEERQAWHDKIAGTLVVRVPRGQSLL
jgi:uncharacterized RDD family membrane protein YckC